MTQEVTERVEALLPTLRERAQEAEDLRRIPDESMKALQETGFFQLLQPKQWGGHAADPVIFYEPKRRYWDKAPVVLGAVPPDAPALDRARIARAGTDCTVVAYGPTVRVALDAATVAESEGRSLEVIDLRSLSPLDLDTLTTSAAKTGRVVVVHEAPTFVGLGAEIAAAVTEQCFAQLEAPVQRVGGWNIPYPPARTEEHYLPDLDRVLDAVDATYQY